jgi:hypothetical protein
MAIMFSRGWGSTAIIASNGPAIIDKADYHGPRLRLATAGRKRAGKGDTVIYRTDVAPKQTKN